MVDWAQLYLFELIFMRMSGFLLFNPLLGRSNLPAMVKTGMALVLSILVFGTAGRLERPSSGLNRRKPDMRIKISSKR